METPAAPPSDFIDKQPIAPLWHLLCVFLLLAAWAGLSLLHPGHHASDKLSPRLFGYLIVLLIEWVLFAFIWLGLRLQGVPFVTLFGNVSLKLRRILLDLGIAVLFLIVANLVLALLTSLLHAVTPAAVKRLLPQTPAEIAVYLLVALTAGICEETIFRGYLQRQFTAYTRSARLGALIQGIIFGLAHVYQGWKMVIIIAVYGCLFGALALWRRSLRPGIIAHILQDSISGLYAARHL